MAGPWEQHAATEHDDGPRGPRLEVPNGQSRGQPSSEELRTTIYPAAPPQGADRDPAGRSSAAVFAAGYPTSGSGGASSALYVPTSMVMPFDGGGGIPLSGPPASAGVAVRTPAVGETAHSGADAFTLTRSMRGGSGRADSYSTAVAEEERRRNVTDPLPAKLEHKQPAPAGTADRGGVHWNLQGSMEPRGSGLQPILFVPPPTGAGVPPAMPPPRALAASLPSQVPFSLPGHGGASGEQGGFLFEPPPVDAVSSGAPPWMFFSPTMFPHPDHFFSPPSFPSSHLYPPGSATSGAGASVPGHRSGEPDRAAVEALQSMREIASGPFPSVHAHRSSGGADAGRPPWDSLFPMSAPMGGPRPSSAMTSASSTPRTWHSNSPPSSPMWGRSPASRGPSPPLHRTSTHASAAGSARRSMSPTGSLSHPWQQQQASPASSTRRRSGTKRSWAMAGQPSHISVLPSPANRSSRLGESEDSGGSLERRAKAPRSMSPLEAGWGGSPPHSASGLGMGPSLEADVETAYDPPARIGTGGLSKRNRAVQEHMAEEAQLSPEYRHLRHRFLALLEEALRLRGEYLRVPTLGYKKVDLLRFYCEVQRLGGSGALSKVPTAEKRRRPTWAFIWKLLPNFHDKDTGASTRLRDLFHKSLRIMEDLEAAQVSYSRPKGLGVGAALGDADNPRPRDDGSGRDPGPFVPWLANGSSTWLELAIESGLDLGRRRDNRGEHDSWDPPPDPTGGSGSGTSGSTPMASPAPDYSPPVPPGALIQNLTAEPVARRGGRSGEGEEEGNRRKEH